MNKFKNGEIACSSCGENGKEFKILMEETGEHITLIANCGYCDFKEIKEVLI